MVFLRGVVANLSNVDLLQSLIKLLRQRTTKNVKPRAGAEVEGFSKSRESEPEPTEKGTAPQQ